MKWIAINIILKAKTTKLNMSDWFSWRLWLTDVSSKTQTYIARLIINTYYFDYYMISLLESKAVMIIIITKACFVCLEFPCRITIIVCANNNNYSVFPVFLSCVIFLKILNYIKGFTWSKYKKKASLKKHFSYASCMFNPLFSFPRVIWLTCKEGQMGQDMTRLTINPAYHCRDEIGC